MGRKTGYIAGLALVLQAIPHFIVFIVLAAKNHKMWKTMLPIACAEVGIGALLMIPNILREIDKIHMVDAVWGRSGGSIKHKAKKRNHEYYFDEPFGFASDFRVDQTNIPVDETATETEFH